MAEFDSPYQYLFQASVKEVMTFDHDVVNNYYTVINGRSFTT